MIHTPTNQQAIKVRGSLKRIRYSNEKNGWTVATFEAETDKKQDIVIVGTLFQPKEGDHFELQGQWSIHPQYGHQFQFESYVPVKPSSTEAMIASLSSGAIPGIGKKLAKRIVDRFGPDTYAVIENDPERLAEVPGIARKRTKLISDTFIEERTSLALVAFLRDHGISPGFAAKIFRTYGKDAVHTIQSNPYKLAEDVPGIGFKKADSIARLNGIEAIDPLRIRAGVMFVLRRDTSIGHAYLPYDILVAKAAEELEINSATIREVIEQMDTETKTRERLHQVPVKASLYIEEDDQAPNDEPVFDSRLRRAEISVTRRMHTLATSASHRPDFKKLADAMEKVEARMGIYLAPEQQKTVRMACEEKVLVCTGGPGTGKTTIIRAIADIYAENEMEVVMAAPTGRAAKRMTEATGFDSVTIHRLLEFSYEEGFQRNEENPLQGDLFVIDEASMIDVLLMACLMRAIPDHATLVLVGDIHQLPSVGPGNVLKDIIQSGTLPVVRLTHIFRQAEQSAIILNAHRINAGQMPMLNRPHKDADFWFMNVVNPLEIQQAVVDLYTRQFAGQDPLNRVQVLTPMHKGPLGTAVLNEILQRELNSNPVGVVRGFNAFKQGDKVMQIRNNYNKEVFNGDIGYITGVDSHDRKLYVNFDGTEVHYEFNELDELVLAYATTIHKAQGSEYPVVVIPMVTQHYIMLARNLLYTAVTRGKSQVILIGSQKAIGVAVRNDKVMKRYSRLRQRLERAIERSEAA